MLLYVEYKSLDALICSLLFVIFFQSFIAIRQDQQHQQDRPCSTVTQNDAVEPLFKELSVDVSWNKTIEFHF